ncbi:PrgI family protein [Candidatus Gracilibacteria bacterium]|nr:PrgI family protein [Candidatus Gracilibacteria bacterium]
MQYKIPIQIENEDVIVAGLSLRQIMIMMVWGGIGYGLFKYAEPRLGSNIGLIIGSPFVLIGVVIALMKISEMTFLHVALNFFRLTLNSKLRIWSQGTDSFSDMEIGYITPSNSQKEVISNKSYEQIAGDEFETNIKKL